MGFYVSSAGQALFVKEKKEKEAEKSIQHCLFNLLSFLHLKSDNITVSNMLFYKQVCTARCLI